VRTRWFRGATGDLTTYLLSQAIGWAVTAGVVAVLVLGLGLPAWLWLAVPLVVTKDLVLLPAMRRAWGPPRAGPESLIGSRGRAVERVGPTGYVRVRGELWQATARAPDVEIPKDRPVVVREVRGLTLVVDEADGSP
jgi:membrane protein implicated in regulation of membrane protease activity